MPFIVPSQAQTRAFIIAHGKALFPASNFDNRQGFHGKWSTFLAGAVTQLHSHANSLNELHPLRAGDGRPINDWGDAYQVLRKGPSPARMEKAGRVRGNAGRTVTPGTQMRHDETGLLFMINNSTTVTIPGVLGVDPDSFVDADIIGVDVGSQTQLSAGSTLVFVAPPIGIEPNVVLQLDLTEDGLDNEQFGSYRGRVLDRMGNSTSGGNQPDFVGWVEASLPAVRKGYAYPNRFGRGTIDVAGFYAASGAARALSSGDRAAVLAYVQSKAPFQVSGTGGGLRVLTTVPDPQRVEILLTSNGVAAYAFDWIGSPTVLSYNATTRELQFSGGALPSSLQAGDRLILVGSVGGSGVTAQDGREYRVEAISAVDKVILDRAPPVNPAATDLIYPGGPLVTPVRDALVEHMNGGRVYAGRGRTPIPESDAAPTNPTGPSVLGLDILAEGIGPSNPAGKYGSWSGGLIRAVLFQIATYKAGVRNATIVSPAADYESPDDGISDGQLFTMSGQIHYITPSVVIVRSA